MKQVIDRQGREGQRSEGRCRPRSVELGGGRAGGQVERALRFTVLGPVLFVLMLGGAVPAGAAFVIDDAAGLGGTGDFGPSVMESQELLVQAIGVEEAERAVLQAEAAHAEVLRRFEAAEQTYRADLEEIEVLRRRVAMRPRELRDLQSALAVSQRNAEALVALEAEVRRARRTLEERRTATRQVIETELARLAATDPSGTRARRDALRGRLAELGAPLPAFRPAPVQAIVEVPYETPEQLRAAADELEDALGAVRARLERIDEEAERARTRERVSRRARGFATDERFLDDGERPRFGQVRVTTAAADRQENGGEDFDAEAEHSLDGDGGGDGVMDEAPAAPGDFADDGEFHVPPGEAPQNSGERDFSPDEPDPGPEPGPEPEAPRPPGAAEPPAPVFRFIRPEADDARDRGSMRGSETESRGGQDSRSLETERALLEAELRRIETARRMLLDRAGEIEREERGR